MTETILFTSLKLETCNHNIPTGWDGIFKTVASQGWLAMSVQGCIHSVS